MEFLIADVSESEFLINYQLEQQIGLGSLPFPKMNKSGAGVCNFFLTNSCSLSTLCPFRHIEGDKTVVCKHWLRGLCKKGDDCDFLHEYDMTKMPECYFFSKFGECMNKECPFLHVDPASKIQDCAWYARGFCRNGPSCRNRHTRRVACQNFINGFCPLGKECKFAHPKWAPLPGADQDTHKHKWVCRYCNERGHKVQFCHKLSLEERQRYQEQSQMRFQSPQPLGGLQGQPIAMGAPGSTGHPPFFSPAGMGAASLNRPLMNPPGLNPHPFDRVKQIGAVGLPRQVPQKPLDEVTCFKCGDKGHYANRCNKGYLAFLSKGSNQVGVSAPVS
uniref:Cleavage and polyadenylation specificity factor subunit 4 n=3 Tax=Schistocephalus solidus TaxID=70667 RepID=A0A0X3PVY0_SCHSO